MQFRYEFATDPYPHQKEIVPILRKKPAFGLIWDMGVGKTLPIIVDLDIRKQLGEPMGGIVFCPSRAKGQWATQIPQHSGGRLTFLIPEGSSRQKMAQMDESDADIFVLNYEALVWLRNYLTKKRWPFIILDESTRVKGIPQRTISTKTAHEMGRSTPIRRIMTGLPNPNSPVDLFSQFVFLDPKLWGGNYYRFRDRYCVMGGFNQKQIVNYKNLPELAKMIQPYCDIRDESTVPLPEKTLYYEDVELDGETLKHYEAMRDELRTWWDGTEVKARIALTQLLRLAQIAGGTVGNGYIVNNPKMRVLDEILESTIRRPTDKVVVFGIYHSEIEAILARYPQYQPRAVYGGVTEKVSTKAWQDFQKEGDPCQLMVAQSHSGGISIDLYAARTAVFFTRDFSLEAYRQSIKRLHRIGQKGTVRIIHLMARLPKPAGRRTRPVSIDESIDKAVERKNKLAKGILSQIKFGTEEIRNITDEVLGA
jgi:SNF2 family DNA or RNA helicase